MSSELENVDPITLEVPSRRVKSGDQAQGIAKRLDELDDEASDRRAAVDGMFDGNPPYQSSKLRINQQSYRANFNPREAEAMLDQKHIPYYDLLSETPELVDVDLKAGDPYQKDRWSRTVAEHFSDMVREWPEWEQHMQLSQLQMLRHGIGPIIFEDKKSWKFKALKRSQVLFPPMTPVADGKWSVIAIRAEYPLHELMEKVSNESVAATLGWNVANVKRAIATATPRTSEDDAISGPTERSQTEIRENYFLSDSTVTKTVSVFIVYWREFDGKISWTIVLKSFNADENKENNEDKIDRTSLFFSPSEFENWEEVLQVFSLGVGDGTINGIFGLGKKIFPHITVNTRLLCQLVDNAFISSTILVQRNADADLEGANLIQAGPMSILPSGYSIQTGQIFSDPTRGLEVKTHLSNILVSNTGSNQNTRPSTPSNKRDVRTATEIEAEDAKLTRIGKNEINRYYSQLDRIYRQMFNRALTSTEDDAKEFRQLCILDGVPKEIFSKAGIKVFKVRAMRAVGSGSFLQRRHIYRELLGNQGLFGERGRYNIKEDYVASLVGQSKVARYLEARDVSDEITADHSFAVLENSAMKQGAPALVVSTQWHVPHMQVHLKAATDGINSIQGNWDNVELLAEVSNFLMIVGPHMAKHLEFIASDPTREQEYRVLVQQFNQVAQLSDEVLNQYSQKLKAEPAPDGSGQEGEQGEGKQVDQARQALSQEAERHAQQIRHREEDHQQKLRIAEEEKAQEIANEN